LRRLGGERQETDGVSDGAPREKVHEREPRRVARRRDEARLFRARVTRGKVRLAVLRRHTHAFDLRALVREEHEPAERQANRVRAAHDEVDVVVRARDGARPALSAGLLRDASVNAHGKSHRIVVSLVVDANRLNPVRRKESCAGSFESFANEIL